MSTEGSDTEFRSYDTAHRVEDCPVYCDPSMRWSLQGISLAARRTGFRGLGILRGIYFDAGVNSNATPRLILISHGHTDHSQALPSLVEGTSGEIPVYMPRELVQPMEVFLRARKCMADCTTMCDDDGFKSSLQMCGIADGERVRWHNMEIACCALAHSVPCNAYLISEVTKKLNPVLIGMPAAELAKISLEEKIKEIAKPILAYLGDTTIAPVPKILQEWHPPVVMMECTYLSREDRPDSAMHCCAEEVFEVASVNPNTTFLFIHFSGKYRVGDIKNTFVNAPANCKAWLPNNIGVE